MTVPKNNICPSSLTPIPRIIAFTADAFTKGEVGCLPAASEPFSLSGGELASKNLLKLDATCGESALASTSGPSATKHAAETRIGNRPQEPGRSLDTAEKEEEQDPGEWAAEEEYAEDEDSTHTHVTHTYTQDARKAAEGPVNPLTPIPHQPQIIPSSPIPHTRAAARAAPAVSEPTSLTGKTQTHFDAPRVGTHTSTPEAEFSSAIVSARLGPQENIDRDRKIRTGGDVDGGGGTELFASLDESHEEDVGEQATAEDEEEQDSGEWVAEEEHEEDEEAPATEAGGSEGSNESVSADSHEELPVLQASDGEEDNERSERRFGYNPDNGDVWGEYQPVVGDPMFACYLGLHGSTI